MRRTHILVFPIILASVAAVQTACTGVYQETMRNMSRTPADLLEVRVTEARQTLVLTRDAFVHLDDGLRERTLDLPAAERDHAQLTRLYERAENQAWEARRRMASVADVAPAYFSAEVADAGDPASPTAAPPPHSLARTYEGLAVTYARLDESLVQIAEALDRDLPTLGAAPNPGVADALRVQVTTLLTRLNDALHQTDAFLEALASPRPLGTIEAVSSR